MVFMASSTDHVTGKTGLTLTITASKAGGAFASITPTVTERGDGWYSLALTTTHANTLGDLALHITGTGADPTDLCCLVIAVDLAVANIAANMTQISGDATAADNLETMLDGTGGQTLSLGALDVSGAFSCGSVLVSGGTTLSNTSTGKALTIATTGSGSPIHIENTPGTAVSLIYLTTGGGTASGIRYIIDSGVDVESFGSTTQGSTTQGTYTCSGAFTATNASNDIRGIDVAKLGGDAQSLADLKDFADAGYDPATNKVQGVVLTDTVTTYTGNTPQTGDSYAIASSVTHGNAALKTLIDTLDDYVDTEVAAIKAKTDNLPSAAPGTSGGILIVGTNGNVSFNSLNIAGDIDVGGTLNADLIGSITGDITGTITGIAGITFPTNFGSFAINGSGQVKLASDGLDSISTTAPTGVASNFREMLVQTWRRFFKKTVRDATTIKTYADNGTTVLTTQSYTSVDPDDNVGAAT